MPDFYIQVVFAQVFVVTGQFYFNGIADVGKLFGTNAAGYGRMVAVLGVVARSPG